MSVKINVCMFLYFYGINIILVLLCDIIWYKTVGIICVSQSVKLSFFSFLYKHILGMQVCACVRSRSCCRKNLNLKNNNWSQKVHFPSVISFYYTFLTKTQFFWLFPFLYFKSNLQHCKKPKLVFKKAFLLNTKSKKEPQKKDIK